MIEGPRQSTAPARLLELDILRGLAVAGMILVVSPGDWNATYAPMRHADWDGWTLADMVFPTFLFSVGVALGLSFPRSSSDPRLDRRFGTRVIRRAAVLVLLGLALEATYNLALAHGGGGPGRPGLANLRIPGILQRIALCYALAAAIIVSTGRRRADGRLHANLVALGAAIAALLLLYWGLLRFVPVPGFGAGRLDPEGNLGAYIDRAIFTVPHLWPLGWVQWDGPVVYDPEGLLSSLPATTNTLFGAVAAQVWRRNDQGRAAAIMAVGGVIVFVAGLAFDSLFVINKRIWTSSFALLSSGFSAVLLAGLIMLTRHGAAATIFTPLRVLGGNAILAFVLSTLLGRFYGLPLIPAANGGTTPRAGLNAVMLTVVPDPYLASLLCGAVMVTIVTACLWPLHRRAFHFRL